MVAKRMGEAWWRPPADDNDVVTAMATAMAAAVSRDLYYRDTLLINVI
jgi:hypothetical protein